MGNELEETEGVVCVWIMMTLGFGSTILCALFAGTLSDFHFHPQLCVCEEGLPPSVELTLQKLTPARRHKAAIEEPLRGTILFQTR